MKEFTKIDFTVIGAGVIGLFTAWELSKKYKNKTVCLLEKSDYLGDHSSGRNSGVLHAGIYYPQNSLKQRYCLEGNKKWRELSDIYKFQIKDLGKYIFSNEEEDINKLVKQAELNGVEGVRKDSISKIKNFVNAKYCLFSSRTSIVNVPEVLKILDKLFVNNGGILLKNHKLDKINLDKDKIFNINFDKFQIKSKYVINCAGLGSIKVRKLLNLNELTNRYILGSYLKTTQKLKFKHLLYPVPADDLSTLGIHSTIDFGGLVKFGPSAEPISSINYKADIKSVDKMKLDVKKNFKNVDLAKLSYDYSGIRSKIELNGKLFDDFWIKSPINNYIEACGIDSPGLTSAPIIANKILDLINL